MARDRGWTRTNPMLLRLSIFATTIFASHSFVLPPTGPMKPHARAAADMNLLRGAVEYLNYAVGFTNEFNGTGILESVQLKRAPEDERTIEIDPCPVPKELRKGMERPEWTKRSSGPQMLASIDDMEIDVAKQKAALLAAKECGALSDALYSQALDEVMDRANAAIDVVVESIVKEELAALASASPEDQEAQLPTLLARVEKRAVDEQQSGFQVGEISKNVVEATRGEVQRQMDAEWSANDLSLLLKVGLFLGAGAAAPAAGLAAMPAAVVLATYGTVLKAELGVRAVQEVGVRLSERAAQGIADGVKSYTGKEEYKFGDLTEETVHRITGKDDYKFGDLSRGALKSVTGKDGYEFGDITKGLFKKLRGDEKEKK